MSHQGMLIITGPTGVGKTDCALAIASQVSSVIINADVGQFYTPLTIGTAKPDWRSSVTPHYLFDVINDPLNLSVVDYKKLLIPCLKNACDLQKLPIVVGGSSFYIQSIFFTPSVAVVEKKIYKKNTQELWAELVSIDPNRANNIAPTDRYRITRALDIWYNLGVRPSERAPKFDPITPALMVVLTCAPTRLYERINARVIYMLQSGWIEEVCALSSLWQDFLLKKKLIGYDDIVQYIRTKPFSYNELIAKIQQKTRNYAKRQMTFNRMLAKKLVDYKTIVRVQWLDVTDKSIGDAAQEIYSSIDRELYR